MVHSVHNPPHKSSLFFVCFLLDPDIFQTFSLLVSANENLSWSPNEGKHEWIRYPWSSNYNFNLLTVKRGKDIIWLVLIEKKDQILPWASLNHYTNINFKSDTTQLILSCVFTRNSTLTQFWPLQFRDNIGMIWLCLSTVTIKQEVGAILFIPADICAGTLRIKPTSVDQLNLNVNMEH